MPNILIEIAKRDGRDYITPEDVAQARREHPIQTVRLHLLQCLGGECGAEDRSLCAFVGGVETEEDDFSG